APLRDSARDPSRQPVRDAAHGRGNGRAGEAAAARLPARLEVVVQHRRFHRAGPRPGTGEWKDLWPAPAGRDLRPARNGALVAPELEATAAGPRRWLRARRIRDRELRVAGLLGSGGRRIGVVDRA